MSSLRIARNAIAGLGWLLLAGGSAYAAGAPAAMPATLIVAPHGGTPQWTFNVNVAVDHILPQFSTVGSYCQVNSGNAYVSTGTGSAERPLAGGAFSGTLSVPVYLTTGALASQGKTWTCSLYFKDAQGKLTYPGLLNTTDPNGPKQGTSSQLTLNGNL
ncbi:MAG TPA: hypothetical protein VKF82_05170 [Candidatus Eremiobacteraceae bacterium]|nr:hypothetical protein [Candidatus Eremiobacteraceae bacterium]